MSKPKSLLLAHRLSQKRILIVGGGEVAYTRLLKLDQTDCIIYLVSPAVTPEIQTKFVDSGRITWLEKLYSIDDLYLCWKDLESGQTAVTEKLGALSLETSSAQDLGSKTLDQLKQLHEAQKTQRKQSWAFILTCLNDHIVSETIYYHSKLIFPDVPINVADNPPFCDFYFGANVELGANGELQLMISSNGVSPRYTALLKKEIYKKFGNADQMSLCVGNLQKLRSGIRVITPGKAAQDIEFRMSWVTSVTDAFGLEGCATMDADKLLVLYKEMFEKRSLDFPADLVEQYSL
ncbi:hypothetical protein ACO0QE_003678 [Hanseniaspora vineae]